VRKHFEPQIAADPKGRCAAILASIEEDQWSKDPALPVPTRGGTLASVTLAQDVYKQALADASCEDIDSVELLVLESTPMLIREQWTMHGCGKAVPLSITFTPGAAAGTTSFMIKPGAGADPAE
jgi:hypothetical protein